MYFWFFTLLGLTVPYRSYVAGISDELNIHIVKEVSIEGAEEQEAEGLGGWGIPTVGSLMPRTTFWKRPEVREMDTNVKRQFEGVMRSLNLYKQEEGGREDGGEGEKVE